MPAIIAKKCGLVFMPPMLVIIYQVDSETTPRSTKPRSPVKMRKHVIPLRLLLKERTDVLELLQRLGETKEHGKFVKSVPVQQLSSLIELLQKKQRGEDVDNEIRKRRESMTRKNGQSGAERQISAINEEEENSLRNSIKSTSSVSTSKDDTSRTPKKSPSKTDSEVVDDLNKVSEEELLRKKAEMDVLFEKNAKKPGDPDFVYDKEVDFEGEQHSEASWDEDGEDNTSASGERSHTKRDAEPPTQTSTPSKSAVSPAKSPAAHKADDQDDKQKQKDKSSSSPSKKDADDDRFDAAFDFDDDDDFEFDAKAKSGNSPSKIPVPKRLFPTASKKAEEEEEDEPF